MTEKARVRKPIGRQGLGKWHFRPTFIVQCPSSCSDARNWTGMLQGTPRQTEPGQFTENADKYKPHGLKASDQDRLFGGHSTRVIISLM